MTPEEKAAARKAAEEQFRADVAIARGRIKQRLCPTCQHPGVYTGQVKIADEAYQVSFRCLIDHSWSVQVGKIEAHALRPIPPCSGKPLGDHRLRPGDSIFASICLDCHEEFATPPVIPKPLEPLLNGPIGPQRIKSITPPGVPAIVPRPASDTLPPLVADGTPAPHTVDPPPLIPDRAPTEPVLTQGPICGACREPLGVKYYAGVSTMQGKLDLCLKCHAMWESGAFR